MGNNKVKTPLNHNNHKLKNHIAFVKIGNFSIISTIFPKTPLKTGINTQAMSSANFAKTSLKLLHFQANVALCASIKL
jgi:hypothetical protein